MNGNNSSEDAKIAGNHAGGVHAQREVAHPALLHAFANDPARVLDRNAPLAALDDDDETDHAMPNAKTMSRIDLQG